LIHFNDNVFRIYTKDAVYILFKDGDRIRHCGFIPKHLESEFNINKEKSLFVYPIETQLSVMEEPINAVADSRQNEGLCGQRLRFRDYRIDIENDQYTLIITTEDKEKTHLLVEDYYTVCAESPGIRRKSNVINRTNQMVTVEHLSSFNLYHFPMFGSKDGAEDLVLHTFRSQWMFEAEHLQNKLGNLGLLNSNCRNCWHIESNSSFSSREYIPCFVLEDQNAKICWAVQLEHSGPWRFEVGSNAAQDFNQFYMTGGIGNARYAQWQAILKPGESYQSAECSLVVSQGDLNDVLNDLRTHQQKVLINHSNSDLLLPVVYNEWQNSFGYISEEVIYSQLDALKQTGIDVYVVDAGWFCPKPDPQEQSYFKWWMLTGNWIPDNSRFPHGIQAITEKILQYGMIPGIWCEIEIAGNLSECYYQENLLMKKRGGFVQSSERRFLYFGSEEGRDYAEGVLEQLVSYGFRYIKIDYNSDSAPGCNNDTSSLGEGLIRHVRGLYKVLDRFRKRHPDIILESCSSGGMRLDYGILSRVDICSITDQEDNRFTGEICYNVTRVIHPSQAAGWSTLKSGYSKDEFAYTLINSMVGRMCISGDIQNFSLQQKETLKQAVSLYKSYRHILLDSQMIHHSKDTLYHENLGVKIIEVSSESREIIVLSAIGLKKSKGTHTVSMRFAQPERLYQCSRFPEGEVCILAGDSLSRQFDFELINDYQSALFIFISQNSI